jgi:hypothetical protein
MLEIEIEREGGGGAGWGFERANRELVDCDEIITVMRRTFVLHSRETF